MPEQRLLPGPDEESDMDSGERLRDADLFGLAPVCLLAVDRDGRIVLANRRAEATLG